jgi:hypothetical protein
MHKTDLDRVEFFSKEDMSGRYQLLKAETILRNATKPSGKERTLLKQYEILTAV